VIKKIWFLLILVPFFLAITSCENDCCHDDGVQDSEESREFRIRVIGDACAKDVIGSHSLDLVGSLTVSIDDRKGNNLFRKSFKRAELSSSLKISGINDVDYAVLTVSGFDVNDTNNIRWEGKVDGLAFSSGKKTAVDIVLYPKSGKGCLPEPMNIPRFGHASTLLPDGRILITGGFIQASGRNWIAGKSVEIIDVESGVVENLMDMNEERAMHEVVVLPDGSVVIFGGVRQLSVENRSIDGYPVLPYTFLIQAITVERYVPEYPKLNMRRNGLGINIPNSVQTMNLSFTEIPFLQHQSYVVDESIPSKITAYMVGGLSGTAAAGLLPSNKVFAFDIVDTGLEYVLSPVREIAPGEKSAALLPSAGFNNGKLFSVGGRNNDATHSGTVYDQNSSTPWGSGAPNLFYAASYMLGGTLYTFGGLEMDGDGATLKDDRKPSYRYDVFGDNVAASENSFMTFGNSLFFSDAVYNQKGNHFIVLGGAGGSKENINIGNALYQVVEVAPFRVNISSTPNTLSYALNYKRILPKGVIDRNSRLFITGGVDSLNPDGRIVNVIEINNL